MGPRCGIAIAVTLVGALLTLSCGGAASPPPTYPAAQQEAQTAAQEVLRQGSATCLGIALVTPDRVVWAESYGFADLESRQAPTAATMFGIASVSKMFAPVLVMQLVEQGRVKLDEPLVSYVPSFRMADPRSTAITVRMLLNHASGLPGTTYRNYQPTAPYPSYGEELLATVAQQRLKADPGYMSVYCNDGFTLVEALVAAVTGKSYAETVQTAILDPLGMRHTAYTLAPFPQGSYAKAYGNSIPQPQEFASSLAAAGLYSTPTDLATFARIFLNGGTVGTARILGPSSVDQMAIDQTKGSFSPVQPAYPLFGLGWDSVLEPGLQAVGIQGWAKNGGSLHYGAQLLVAPGAGLAVVVMGTNGAGYDPGAIAQRVLLRALVETGRIAGFPAPVPPVAAPVATAPEGLLASLVGEYANHEDLFQLQAEPDGSLTLLTFSFGAGRFEPSLAGLRYRSDGWFTGDAAPLASLRVVAAEGRQYLGMRGADGAKHYLVQFVKAQRVLAKAPLSWSWLDRLGFTWLVVNETPKSLIIPAASTPCFSLNAVSELPGLIATRPAGGLLSPNLLDPSGSASLARMMVVIPGNYGRDLNDLEVVVRGGEEWLRWGGWLHRPMATVPILPAGMSSRVLIGAEGHSEWRSLRVGALPLRVSVSGASAWRCYDQGFNLLASGEASGQGTLPAGAGLGYLQLFGTPGASFSVAVP
ncbi:MAG: serine hydrolase domain-containing protein [Geothrix sp.]